MKNLIIDSSSLIFRAYYATCHWTEDINKAINLYSKWLDRLSAPLEPTDRKFCAIDKNNKESENFKILDSYKAGRHTPELLSEHFNDFHEEAKMSGYKIVGVDGEEADDVVASLIKRIKDDNEDAKILVVSNDKDLLQLVSHDKKIIVLRPISQGGTKFEVMNEKRVCNEFGIARPEQVIDIKALIGDGSDGYQGVKGIGIKRAQKLLSDFNDIDGIYDALEKDAIRGAQARYLKEGKENAYMCRSLAKLNGDLLNDK